MAVSRVYPPAERPDVEVLVEGVWYPGELRMWSRADEGWVAQVQWRRCAGENRLGSFAADQVRPA